jgi:hypothetical protein
VDEIFGDLGDLDRIYEVRHLQHWFIVSISAAVMSGPDMGMFIWMSIGIVERESDVKRCNAVPGPAEAQFD